MSYELKKYILDSGIYQKYKDLQRAQFKLYCAKNEIELLTYEEQMNLNLDYFFNNMVDYEVLLECRRLYDSTRARVGRLRKRISKFLHNHDCLFLTLTFRNDVLSSTTSDTRRRYIARFLKSLNCNYVANIDFGKQNGREHYHAVIDIYNIDFSLYKYGAINGVKIVTKNELALAKYIAKLTNHAIKETTKGSRIIYNRGVL